MLPVVPELGPRGFTHTAEAARNAPRGAPAILPDGSSWCRINCPRGIAGRIFVRPAYADLYLGLNPASGRIEYTDLSFGYRFTADGVEIGSGAWPESGRKYLRSDQPWILVGRVRYAVQSVLAAMIWAEDGDRFDTTWTMQGPRPIQPFPSWSWDGSEWQPPVPDPGAPGEYRWDEASQGWVLA